MQPIKTTSSQSHHWYQRDAGPTPATIGPASARCQLFTGQATWGRAEILMFLGIIQNHAEWDFLLILTKGEGSYHPLYSRNWGK